MNVHQENLELNSSAETSSTKEKKKRSVLEALSLATSAHCCNRLWREFKGNNHRSIIKKKIPTFTELTVNEYILNQRRPHF